MTGRKSALMWMLVATLFFVFQGVAFKVSTRWLPPVQMMVIRNAGALLMLWCWLGCRGQRVFKPVNGRLLALRGILGTGGMIGYFYGLHLLPMAEVVTIHKTAPFIILVIARVFLGEPITRRKIAAFVVAMAGVMVVFQPGFERFGGLLFLPLAAALFSGAAHASIRRLNDTDHPTTIVSGFFLISLPILVPLMVLDGIAVPVGMFQWALVVAVGLFTVLAQLAMTLAYRYGPAGEVALYSYSSIPVAAIFSFFLFEDPLTTGTATGSILIILAAFLMHREIRRSIPV